MTAKEYLSEVQRLQIIIEQKKERIKEIRESTSTVRAVRFDLEKVQGSRQTERIGEVVSKIVDLEKEVENDIVNLLYFKNEIMKQIQVLKNPNHIKLLYKRYIEVKKFSTIAEEMNYTDQYIKEMHGKALKAFKASNKGIFQKEDKAVK